MKKTIFWLFLAFFGFESCRFNYWKLQQRNSMIEQKMADARLDFPFSIGYFESPAGRKLRFMAGGDPSADRLVFFLHGSPSSMSKWSPFFQDSFFQRKARLVAVDRPGYGQSGLGRSVVDLNEQKAILQPLVEHFLAEKAGRKVIFVSSSYGSAVAVSMSIALSERLAGLILSGASLAAGEERVPKIARTIRVAPFLFPKVARSATREKIRHRTTLEQLEKADWAAIRCRVKIIHGIFDDLIFFPQNPDFACKKLVSAAEVEYITVPTKHFLMWTHPEPVSEGLRAFLAN